MRKRIVFFARKVTIVSTLAFAFCLASGIAVAQQNESAAGDAPAAAPVAPADWRHYNANPQFQPGELPNGSVANLDSLTRTASISRIDGELRAIKVTDDTWMLGGDVYGSTVLETDEGLVIVSPGSSAESGREFRRVIREQISEKPVVAIIYDHIHGARGTETLLDGDVAPIIAHPDHNDIAAASGGASNPYISELGPHVDARAELHMGVHLPASGPDAQPGGTLDFTKEVAWMPATQTVEHGETISVAGIEMQFFHAITDSEDTLTIWIPEKQMVIDNVVWPFTNTYTLRGDRFRDPRNWIAALRQIRDLQPEIVLSVGAGGAPLIGRQACQNAVSALMDQMSFIYDQSLRLTSQGVNMSEIRHHIRLPDSLLADPYNNETYGQFDTFPQANPIYNHGWFSGYAEDIHSLPRAAKADYLVKLAGGAEKVVAAYEEAMENAEFLWAKELAAQLYYTDPANETYRQALADVFRRLGQMSPGGIVRNFYLSAANSLEGSDVISIAGVQSAAWITANLDRVVDFLRIRINPQLADGVEGVLLFDIDGKVSALHVRNSIAEFVPDPDSHYRQPDGQIKASAEDFAGYFRGEIGVDSLLSSGTASGRAKELLALFDGYERTPMYPHTRRTP
jgi:alkyl sulfatase BDS1-like metallo-beta-lactamase superfamily hydrolase